jgi:3-hydroxyanthranilate 3,4-dioxygenase
MFRAVVILPHRVSWLNMGLFCSLSLRLFSKKWISENKSKLQPPVGAELVFECSEDYIIIVVGGPNRRSDFHINQSEEFFFQLQGDAELIVHVDGHFETMHLTEGSVFLLPANVPHSPQRKANTVGLVVERRRTGDLTDGLRW